MPAAISRLPVRQSCLWSRISPPHWRWRSASTSSITATSFTKGRRWKSRNSRKCCSVISACKPELRRHIKSGTAWPSRFLFVWRRKELRLQRRDQLCRMLFDHLGTVLAALPPQQRNTFPPRHHMHVEVKYHLAARGLAELLEDEAVRGESLHSGARDDADN